jgi:hypothetical protein
MRDTSCGIRKLASQANDVVAAEQFLGKAWFAGEDRGEIVICALVL